MSYLQTSVNRVDCRCISVKAVHVNIDVNVNVSVNTNVDAFVNTNVNVFVNKHVDVFVNTTEPFECGRQHTLNSVYAQTAAWQQSNGNFEARMSEKCG